jgi:hypothetical protein
MQRAIRPFRRVGFHRIDTVALQANQFGSAGPVRHCHQPFLTLRAAGNVHANLLFGKFSEQLTEIKSFGSARKHWYH